MAKPILVANWKNYPSSPDGVRTLLKGLSRRSAVYKKCFLYIAPPYPYIKEVSEKAGRFARVASQDVSGLVDGTYTGVVDNHILKGLGVALSIVGHSERRALGERDEDVALKVKGAISAGISPLVCIGERIRDKDGEHLEYLRKQMFATLSVLKPADAKKLLIAYEPVWAVGKDAQGVVEPEDLAEVVIFIKKILADIFGRPEANKIPVLYGGSVDTSNAESLYRNTGIRGFLVGRASLRADTFASIAEAII